MYDVRSRTTDVLARYITTRTRDDDAAVAHLDVAADDSKIDIVFDETVAGVGRDSVSNLQVSPVRVGFNARGYHPTPDGSTAEYAAWYCRLDHSESDNVLGLYMEVDAGQSQVGGSATKVIHRGGGDAHYVALQGDRASAYGYEAAMFGGDQGGGIDKQENGFLGSFQGAAGYAASRKQQSNSIPFHALVHDDGVDPTSPDPWATNYGLFYANNSLANAFRVRCSQYALEFPQIGVSDTDLTSRWAVYTSGDMYNFGDAATSGAQNKPSRNVILTGFYWDGASENRRSRLVTNVSGAPAGKASLYIYCGPASGETLIGYFSEVADGTNPGLNMQNHTVYACGNLTGGGSSYHITNFQDASFLGTTLRVIGRRTVTNANDSGNDGDLCWDTNYVYFGVGSNTWKRVAISTW